VAYLVAVEGRGLRSRRTRGAVGTVGEGGGGPEVVPDVGGVLTREDDRSAGRGVPLDLRVAKRVKVGLTAAASWGVVRVGRTALRQSSCTRGRCQRRCIREGQPSQLMLIAFHAFTSSRCCPFAV